MARFLLASAVLLPAACGGDKKPPPKKPVVQKDDTPPPKPETEEDRAAKRLAAAHEIVPEGSTCLPLALKEDGAPRLELAAVGSDAILCANDIEPKRLLGMVACWKVDIAEGGLIYQEPKPLPGRNISVKLDNGCARGYCVPKAEGDTAHMAWSEDGSKVVVVIGKTAYLFDAAEKKQTADFELAVENGVTNEPSAVHWVGENIYVEGADAGPASYVFVFKPDGTAVGPIKGIGAKDPMLSTFGGSFVVLDKNRVGVAEKGFSTLTIYESGSGKRTKIVRKVTNGPCKPAEVEAFWTESGEVPAKCKDHMTKTFGHLIGADAVAGKKNLLALLRGARLGELAVLDAKNLAETNKFKLPWCEAGEEKADAGAKDEKATADSDDAEGGGAKPKATRGAKPKKTEDPEQGGE